MDSGEYSSEHSGECRPLLDACTPFVYQYNAFRITGLIADASVRDIKRRIDDLKHAEEIGDAEEEHSHAFALNPPPNLEHIREAALQLQDPERRMIEEFFWFWPAEWGQGKYDPALLALARGDPNVPFGTWTRALAADHSAIRVTSKHNLAVLYHLVALDWELVCLEKRPSEESLATIDSYWRKCLLWWGELAEDETFWSLVTDRIRSVDDPRLTTGFARRMRATLPEAMDRINALLAIQYIERHSLDLSRRQISYMNLVHGGYHNASKTLGLITKPLQTRIRDAVTKASQIARQQPEKAAEAAHDLFKTIAQPLEIIKGTLPQGDHDLIDLCDAVAEAGLTCQIAFGREQRDWKECLAILDEAGSLAESEDVKERIAEHCALAEGASLLDPIIEACEKAFSAAEHSPEDAVGEGEGLLSSVKPTLDALDESNAPDEMKTRARDDVARTVTQCAILFGNKAGKWKPCIGLLEAALLVAASPDVKDYITKNLDTARQNEQLFGTLKPISSAPSLSTRNGIGFALYGATDRNAATGSYLSTYYFVFLGIPIFPICRYRVIPMARGYRFLGKAPLRTFDRWHLFISLVVIAALVLYIGVECNSGPTYSSSRSYSPPSRNVSPSPRSYGSGYSRSSLAREIEDGKRRAKQMEAELDAMDNRLDSLEKQLNSYRASGWVDQYNALVPSYNSLVGQRRSLYEEYSRLVTEVNAKVNQYNSGLR